MIASNYVFASMVIAQHLLQPLVARNTASTFLHLLTM